MIISIRRSIYLIQPRENNCSFEVNEICLTIWRETKSTLLSSILGWIWGSPTDLDSGDSCHGSEDGQKLVNVLTEHQLCELVVMSHVKDGKTSSKRRLSKKFSDKRMDGGIPVLPKDMIILGYRLPKRTVLFSINRCFASKWIGEIRISCVQKDDWLEKRCRQWLLWCLDRVL